MIYNCWEGKPFSSVQWKFLDFQKCHSLNTTQIIFSTNRENSLIFLKLKIPLLNTQLETPVSEHPGHPQQKYWFKQERENKENGTLREKWSKAGLPNAQLEQAVTVTTQQSNLGVTSLVRRWLRRDITEILLSSECELFATSCTHRNKGHLMNRVGDHFKTENIYLLIK